ncbi:MAG: hypothetical protein WD403_15935, partial [Pirellulales bacterium]
MPATKRSIAIVTQPTRLKGLLRRWVTPRQAAFRLKQAHLHEAMRQGKAVERAVPEESLAAAPAAFAHYEREDEVYEDVTQRIGRELQFDLPLRFVERRFVPTFDFQTCELVVVVGQDGLVANAAKYVGDRPIVAVNPDPAIYDGILLPFRIEQARRAVGQVLDGKARYREITLAEVLLNDGQRMLAFNDFFLGAASHVSARYVIRLGDEQEPQSSSGVLVATGAGSTGWFSSVFNMLRGLNRWMGVDAQPRLRLDWEDRRASQHRRHSRLIRQFLNRTDGGVKQQPDVEFGKRLCRLRFITTQTSLITPHPTINANPHFIGSN